MEESGGSRQVWQKQKGAGVPTLQQPHYLSVACPLGWVGGGTLVLGEINAICKVASSTLRIAEPGTKLHLCITCMVHLCAELQRLLGGKKSGLINLFQHQRSVGCVCWGSFYVFFKPTLSDVSFNNVIKPPNILPVVFQPISIMRAGSWRNLPLFPPPRSHYRVMATVLANRPVPPISFPSYITASLLGIGELVWVQLWLLSLLLLIIIR